VRLELTLAEAAVKNSEEETEALRERLEDAEERARHAAEVGYREGLGWCW